MNKDTNSERILAAAISGVFGYSTTLVIDLEVLDDLAEFWKLIECL